MSIHQDIERQERDFKDLLNKVMRDPLAPILDSVKELESRLEQVETMLQDIRDVELTALSLTADETVKKVDAVRSISRDTPREVGAKMQPLLDQMRTQLEEGALHKTHELIEQRSAHFDSVADQVVGRLTNVTDAMSESRAVLDSTLRRNAAHLEGAIQSASGQIETSVQHATEQLSGIAVQQVAAHRQLLDQLQASIKHEAAALQEHVATRHDRVGQQIAALAESIAATQQMLTRQTDQLNTFRQQQDALAERFGEQVRHATQHMRTWLIVMAGVACASSAAAFFMSGKF
jgi:ribosome recycling factor